MSKFKIGDLIVHHKCHRQTGCSFVDKFFEVTRVGTRTIFGRDKDHPGSHPIPFSANEIRKATVEEML